MSSQSDSIVTVGIDVGGVEKGFHAVALKNGKYLDHWPKMNDPRNGCEQIYPLVKWCKMHDAQMIAIDAPCRWSNDGRSRPAERQLQNEGIWSFSTPTPLRAKEPQGHYGWMLQGAKLYQALETTYPLITEVPQPGTRCCFETYPHAITWYLRGGNANATEKRSQRRALLKQAGVDLTKLTNIDLIDAGLCAFTAHQAATGRNLKAFGDNDTGRIFVPTPTVLKLYKFRPLFEDGSVENESFKRVKEILENKEFYCSKLWDQNDPMEGVYSYLPTGQNGIQVEQVFSEKNKFRVCSFSGAAALQSPTIWGYYANGFKGVAIEIKVPLPSSSIVPVSYLNQPHEWGTHQVGSSTDDQIKSIITSKLKAWKNEHEYRFLSKKDKPQQFVGEITGVYFGDPYHGIENRSEVLEQSLSIKSYLENRKKLVEIAECCGYPCYFSRIGRSGGNWKVTHTGISPGTDHQLV